jgi:hypothetical protein
MIIILKANIGYKSTDLISSYAHEIVGFSEAASATIGATFLFLRLIIAVLIGFAADKLSAIFWVEIGFVTAIIGAGLFTFGVAVTQIYVVFISSTILFGIGIFSLRALYFALFKERAYSNSNYRFSCEFDFSDRLFARYFYGTINRVLPKWISR